MLYLLDSIWRLTSFLIDVITEAMRSHPASFSKPAEAGFRLSSRINLFATPRIAAGNLTEQRCIIESAKFVKCMHIPKLSHQLIIRHIDYNRNSTYHDGNPKENLGDAAKIAPSINVCPCKASSSCFNLSPCHETNPQEMVRRTWSIHSCKWFSTNTFSIARISLIARMVVIPNDIRLFVQNGSTSVSTWMVNAVSTRTCEKTEMITEMWRCKATMHRD